MSYSSWGDSTWYTFWKTQPDNMPENYDNAIFCVDCSFEFTAKRLREKMDNCLAMVKSDEPNCDEDEIEELRQYMNEFLADVEREYR